MKRYWQTAKGLLLNPVSMIENLPSAEQSGFWIRFLILTFCVAQIGVAMDVAVLAGKGAGRLAVVVFENAVMYALTPLLLHGIVRLFGGRGRLSQTLRIVACTYNANMLVLIISPAWALIRQSGLLERGQDGHVQQPYYIAMLIMFFLVFGYLDKLTKAFFAGMEKEYGFGKMKSGVAGLLVLGACVLALAPVVVLLR